MGNSKVLRVSDRFSSNPLEFDMGPATEAGKKGKAAAGEPAVSHSQTHNLDPTFLVVMEVVVPVVVSAQRVHSQQAQHFEGFPVRFGKKESGVACDVVTFDSGSDVFLLPLSYRHRSDAAVSLEEIQLRDRLPG